jgi:hypothetical protein
VHTIAARSVAQPGAMGSAKVWVANYPGMFTYHGDHFRSGVNLQEFALTANTVRPATFGQTLQSRDTADLTAKDLDLGAG